MSTPTGQSDRSAYLRDLKIVVNARSPWLMRDFVQRWRSTLGPLATVMDAKADGEIGMLLEETAAVLRGDSTHQLAAQLISPWLLKRAT